MRVMTLDFSLIKSSAVNSRQTLSRMPDIGKGVEELRIWDDTGTYRVVYTAKLADAVYVLHAFQKKTQATSKSDIELAKKRYNELKKDAKNG